jgi:hypothetical protein
MDSLCDLEWHGVNDRAAEIIDAFINDPKNASHVIIFDRTINRDIARLDALLFCEHFIFTFDSHIILRALFGFKDAGALPVLEWWRINQPHAFQDVSANARFFARRSVRFGNAVRDWWLNECPAAFDNITVCLAHVSDAITTNNKNSLECLEWWRTHFARTLAYTSKHRASSIVSSLTGGFSSQSNHAHFLQWFLDFVPQLFDDLLVIRINVHCHPSVLEWWMTHFPIVVEKSLGVSCSNLRASPPAVRC